MNLEEFAMLDASTASQLIQDQPEVAASLKTELFALIRTHDQEQEASTFIENHSEVIVKLFTSATEVIELAASSRLCCSNFEFDNVATPLFEKQSAVIAALFKTSKEVIDFARASTTAVSTLIENQVAVIAALFKESPADIFTLADINIDVAKLLIDALEQTTAEVPSFPQELVLTLKLVFEKRVQVNFAELDELILLWENPKDNIHQIIDFKLNKLIKKELSAKLMALLKSRLKDPGDLLKSQLKDPGDNVCKMAKYVLEKLAEKVNSNTLNTLMYLLKPWLKDSNVYVRKIATSALAVLIAHGLIIFEEFAEFAKLMALLKPRLEDTDANIRLIATNALAELIEKKQTACLDELAKLMDLLTPRLTDSNENVRVTATRALIKLIKETAPNNSAKLMDLLTPQLQDPNNDVRIAAIHALIELIKKANPDEDELAKLMALLKPRLEETDANIRLIATKALLELIKKANPDEDELAGLMALLKPQLKNSWDHVIEKDLFFLNVPEVIEKEALVKLIEEVNPAKLMPSLALWLNDSDNSFGGWAAYTLKNLIERATPTELMPLLTFCLKNFNDTVHTVANYALIKLIEKATSAEFIELRDLVTPFLGDHNLRYSQEVYAYAQAVFHYAQIAAPERIAALELKETIADSSSPSHLTKLFSPVSQPPYDPRGKSEPSPDGSHSPSASSRSSSVGFF